MFPLIHSINGDRKVLVRLTFGFNAMFVVFLSFCPACLKIEKHISLNKCYVLVIDYPAMDKTLDKRMLMLIVMSVVKLHKSDVYVSIITFIPLRLN